MGHNAHPTVNVSNNPEQTFAVVDRSDSYNPIVVARFDNESAANELCSQLNEEKYELSGREPFTVSDGALYESVEQFKEHSNYMGQ